jgi:hypothetical protein
MKKIHRLLNFTKIAMHFLYNNLLIIMSSFIFAGILFFLLQAS